MNTRLNIFFLLLLGFFSIAPAITHGQISISSNQSFEQSLVELANGDRAAQGLSALSENSLLSEAAQEKANDMAAKGYFSHVSPDGTSSWYWFTAVGYYYTHAGENLALDFNTPSSLEAAWMASPEHRANILKGVYTQIGVGIAYGEYQGKPATFIVELFATPANLSASNTK